MTQNQQTQTTPNQPAATPEKPGFLDRMLDEKPIVTGIAMGAAGTGVATGVAWGVKKIAGFFSKGAQDKVATEAAKGLVGGVVKIRPW